MTFGILFYGVNLDETVFSSQACHQQYNMYILVSILYYFVHVGKLTKYFSALFTFHKCSIYFLYFDVTSPLCSVLLNVLFMWVLVMGGIYTVCRIVLGTLKSAGFEAFSHKRNVIAFQKLAIKNCRGVLQIKMLRMSCLRFITIKTQGKKFSNSNLILWFWGQKIVTCDLCDISLKPNHDGSTTKTLKNLCAKL